MGLPSAYLIPAFGQALEVAPVTLQFAPGQKAATLTVTNHGSSETAIQIRAFRWSQADGEDKLTPTNDILLSPPITVIPAGHSQLIRMVLKESAERQESSYRFLLDQIPPPANSGIVRVMLRLSIPIFAEPTTTALASVQFHIESDGGRIWLVGVNDGIRHEKFRDVQISTRNGTKLSTDVGGSPYLLAGATRRWAISVPPDCPPAAVRELRFQAHGDGSAIDQQISLAALP